MAIKPKLEFYRFSLIHREEEYKTFKDFVIDELGARRSITEEKAMNVLFDYFIKSLGGKYAKDDKVKKQIKLESRKTINLYLDQKPRILSGNIIAGVINGGPYGRDRIVADISNPDEGSQLGKTKSILQYYYVLLYLPLDHNEGCFIIHSNGKEETITNIFRRYISNIFKGNGYKKMLLDSFCPKSFQDEFKKGAVIKSMEFKDIIVDSIHTEAGTTEILKRFDIRFEAVPNDKNILVTEALKLKQLFSKYFFGKGKYEKSLNDFDEAKVSLKNPVDDSTKTFEWSVMDEDFVPVVYLDGRIKNTNPDDTPDFVELDELCQEYFKNEVLPEIRPDLFVHKIK